jgi:23S rRNA G2445 N2-methylase RlmL
VRFFVTCARGTEGPLRRELVELHARAPRGDAGGVSFEGELRHALRVCLWSRVGMRVLLELGAFEAADATDLYEGVRAVDWREHLDQHHTVAVSATVRDNPALAHSGYAALKVKDALVDALRDRLGARPDVDPVDPDVRVVLHLDGRQARLYLDLVGEPLHRRGYRVAMTEAPLKETLGAAVLALAGADPQRPFCDPMAGSGTLAIEQALRARGIAPGLRRRFGFERWPARGHLAAWAQLRDEARAAVRPAAPAPIHARDLVPAAIEAARQNAAAAGVAGDITFAVGAADAPDLRLPQPGGLLCTNPPYGERVGAPPADAGAPGRLVNRGGRGDTREPGRDRRDRRDDRRGVRGQDPPRRPLDRQDDARDGADEKQLVAVYEALATLFSRNPAWQAAVLSGNPLFSRVFLRRPDITHRLWNGPLETRLLVYKPR